MNPWEKSLAAPVISPPKTQWTNRKGGSVCCWGSLAAGLAIGIVGDAGVGYLRIRNFQVSIRWYKCGLCWNACGFIFDVVLISCVCLFAKKTLTEWKIRFHDCVLGTSTMNQEIAYQPFISRPPFCRSVLTPSSHDSLLECRLVCESIVNKSVETEKSWS